MNNSYSKILVPYDGSKYSKKALHVAVQFAKNHQSRLYIINVVNISQVSPPGRIFSRSEQKSLNQIKNSIKEATKVMLYEIQMYCESSGIQTSDFILEGSTSEEILQFAKKNHIDLIIIGSRGLSGISKIMTLGSVSRAISEYADCPVMIIH